MSWSGVGGNPPPLKDDLGPSAHQPAASHTSAIGVAVRGGLSRSALVTYSESSCGNWFALSTCHICTPCSKYWPLLSIERILIYIVTWTVEPARRAGRQARAWLDDPPGLSACLSVNNWVHLRCWFQIGLLNSKHISQKYGPVTKMIKKVFSNSEIFSLKWSTTLLWQWSFR